MNIFIRNFIKNNPEKLKASVRESFSMLDILLVEFESTYTECIINNDINGTNATITYPDKILVTCEKPSMLNGGDFANPMEVIIDDVKLLLGKPIIDRNFKGQKTLLFEILIAVHV